MADQIGPRCGNNPNVRLTPGDQKVVDEFRAFLTARAVLRDRIAEALSEARRPGLGGLTEAEAVRRMADAAVKALSSCSDPIECSHEAALGEAREKHRASLRRADEVNNELMAEVQRYAEGTERPVLWSVYNAMHLRAANAESTLERVRTVARRLSAHAVGFQDVLDDSDRAPWGTTVGADIAELIDLLSDGPAAGAGQDGAQS